MDEKDQDTLKALADADEDEWALQMLADAKVFRRAAKRVKRAAGSVRDACAILDSLPSGRLAADVLREELPQELGDLLWKLRGIKKELREQASQEEREHGEAM